MTTNSTIINSNDKGTSLSNNEVQNTTIAVSTILDESEDNEGTKTTEFTRDALLFMISAFMIEAIMWGFPSSFGIFQTYYSSYPLFHASKFISTIGTLATGLPFLGAPLITPMVTRSPKHRQRMVCTGCGICILGLVGASFATQIWHLILTQGVIYGVGFLLLYYPLLSMLNEWFVKHRGLAYGILFAAAGLSGLGLPFLLQKLLISYGLATTLRIYAVATTILVCPTLPLLRPLQSLSGTEPSTLTQDAPKIDLGVLRNPVFFILASSNLFQGLAFIIPPIYLPTYSISKLSLPVTSPIPTVLLSLLSTSQVLGLVLLGFASDHLSLPLLLFVSTSLSTLVTFTLWHLAHSMPCLIFFSLAYGVFAGGYTALYGRFLTTLSSDQGTGLWLYGLFALERGVGIVVAGPVSGGLIQGDGSSMESYDGLVLFVGIAFAVSCLSGLGWVFLRGDFKGRRWWKREEKQEQG